MLTKMTMALMLSTTIMTSSLPMPFEKAEGLVVDDDIQIEEFFNTLEFHPFKTPSTISLEKQFEKDRLEKIKREEEEKKRLELERQRQLEEQKRVMNTRTFVLTYYGSTVNECGNSLGITASGKKVQSGMVASPPSLEFGTQIEINGTIYTVEDRGSSDKIKENDDGSIRLDVFIPRLEGENDNQYEKRVNNMGVQRIEGTILRYGRGE